jgi:GH24 family phage-related lysozyme (muramidase)
MGNEPRLAGVLLAVMTMKTAQDTPAAKTVPASIHHLTRGDYAGLPFWDRKGKALPAVYEGATRKPHYIHHYFNTNGDPLSASPSGYVKGSDRVVLQKYRPRAPYELSTDPKADPAVSLPLWKEALYHKLMEFEGTGPVDKAGNMLGYTDDAKASNRLYFRKGQTWADFVAEAARKGRGRPTIGGGLTGLTAAEQALVNRQGYLTPAQNKAIIQARIEANIRRAMRDYPGYVSATPNMQFALQSGFYNYGFPRPGHMPNMYRALMNNRPDIALFEQLDINKQKGAVLEGLRKRREWEDWLAHHPDPNAWYSHVPKEFFGGK